jgi:hypothetical protein
MLVMVLETKKYSADATGGAVAVEHMRIVVRMQQLLLVI